MENKKLIKIAVVGSRSILNKQFVFDTLDFYLARLLKENCGTNNETTKTMWIDNNISKPLRKGNYRTLLNSDGLGNLQECEADYFNGVDWDYMLSNRQFILYWWAEKEDYKTIADHLDKEMETYNKNMEEQSKNFGGL